MAGTAAAMTVGEVVIVKVAVDAPLRRCFDYLAPPDQPLSALRPGVRVRVPFGRGMRTGVLVATARTTEVPPQRLKRVQAVLDEAPLLSAEMLGLLEWAARYYQHPIGEVICGSLPVLLRRGRPAEIAVEHAYRVVSAAAPPKSSRQRALYELLSRHGTGVQAGALDRQVPGWRRTMRALMAGGVVERCVDEPPAGAAGPPLRPELNRAQRSAVEAVLEALDGFGAFVLNGVTGSGKTEVYLRVVEAALRAGRQALVLIPEIGLSTQTVERFRARFSARVVVFHSGLTERERAQAWLAARAGRAAIVIGTRSAVWTPLAQPGVIIVDEEHDLSYKQQDGFHYSARDIALIRARRERIPVLLGTATPSLETRCNVDRGRYRELRLPERTGAASPPALGIIDLRTRRLRGGLAEPMFEAIAKCIAGDGQALIFVNRRGYAPVMMCHRCGEATQCRRCDARMTWHRDRNRLLCHHCGAEQTLSPACPRCGAEAWSALGQGTERVVEALKARFHDVEIVRIDSDSTRRKGALAAVLDQVQSGRARILVGTQMLSKGHHFPGVTLVGVIDADSRLYGVDFRASERLAQLIVQVAGRAGRGGNPGRVFIQTHHPDHPLLKQLAVEGYEGVCTGLLEERRLTGLPPYSHLALLRAEAVSEDTPHRFLERAKAAALCCRGNVEIFGPVPAPMARRAGRYRAQLLLQAAQRQALHRLLEAWLPQIDADPAGRRVRWSIDVDPQELY